jgi:hypothetical protein
MGVLRFIGTGQEVQLEAEHVVGRATAPKCSLTLNELYVSGVHAVLRWNGRAWELKDLSSRNGTYVDGQRIEDSQFQAVRQGARIAFGRLEQEWEIADERPPCVMAVPFDGGEPVLLDGELIALPSTSDPRSTIYRTTAGTWLLEHQDGSTSSIANTETFEAAGRLWRFCCSEVSPATIGAPGVSLVADLDVGRMHLVFSVSRDEEHVHILMTQGTQSVDMGERGHNYLLLTLSRRRQADIAEGLPESSRGWIDQEDLSKDCFLGPHLNLSVFRIRDQFARAGVLNAARIIERRSNPRQLRIGIERFSIDTL